MFGELCLCLCWRMTAQKQNESVLHTTLIRQTCGIGRICKGNNRGPAQRQGARLGRRRHPWSGRRRASRRNAGVRTAPDQFRLWRTCRGSRRLGLGGSYLAQERGRGAPRPCRLLPRRRCPEQPGCQRTGRAPQWSSCRPRRARHHAAMVIGKRDGASWGLRRPTAEPMACETTVE